MFTVALANQKGGTGKTTTAINLSAALARRGHRVLLVDLDPQKSVAAYYNYSPGEMELLDALLDTDDRSLEKLPFPGEDGFDLILSAEGLVEAESRLMAQSRRIWQWVVRDKLKVFDGRYDFAVIDTPPSLGALFTNSLAAADGVIVPLHTFYLSWRAFNLLIDSVAEVRQGLNPRLQILGAVINGHKGHTRSGRKIADILHGDGYTGIPFFETVFPDAVAIADAGIQHQSLVGLAELPGASRRQKELAALYRQLAEEVLARVPAIAAA